MNKKNLIFLFVGIFSASLAIAQKNVESQEYQTAVGVKFYPGAISAKHFIKENQAVEGLAYFWNNGFRITGLYEIHQDINSVQGLKWYAGPGAHVTLFNTNGGGGTGIGIDGVLGLDYKFKGAPLNMSIDWQPAFEFGGKNHNGFYGGWGGLGIRYVL